MSLSFDLLSGPSCSLNGASLELTVTLSIFDERRDPVSTVVVGIVAIGESICQVSMSSSAQGH